MKEGVKIDINQRVKDIFFYLKENNKIKSKTEFAKYLGLLPQTLNGIFNNKQYFTTEHLSNLIKYFPELNAEWLLTGRGSMLKKRKKAQP